MTEAQAQEYTPVNSLLGERSKTILVLTPSNYVANTRLFLPMDADINNSIITGITANAHINNYQLAKTININGVNYDTIEPPNFLLCLLTILDNNRNQVLNQMPLSALYPQNLNGVLNAKTFFKKMFIPEIKLEESYIYFTQSLGQPIAVPITFHFNPY